MNYGIVGAGIMGRLLAWQLAKRGDSVTLFDRDKIDHGNDNGLAAAYTAAGMLTPISEAESTEAEITTLGLRSLQLWPEIVKQLPQDVDFHQRGSIILAHSNDRPELLNFRNHVARTPAAIERVTQLDSQQITELEPELAKHFNDANFIPGESWLSSQACMSVLAKDLQNMSATLIEQAQIDNIESGQVEHQNQTYKFDCVIDCRGIGAKPDLPTLRGVRGEVVLLHAPEVNIRHLVRLMHPRYRIYIVPRANHHYVIGATQIESSDTSNITVRSALELLSAAYSVHPGFGEANIMHTRVNCRPALPDNLPKITHDSGLMRINGLFRHGFLLAPALAEKAIHLLTNAK